MTIAEMLAKRGAKAGVTLGKHSAPPAALIVREGAADGAASPPQAAAAAMPEPRSLSAVKGEALPLTPANATAEEARWHLAAQGLAGELCAVRHPDDPETAWIALRHPTNRRLPMLLLHPLPWVLFETPTPDAPPAKEEEPY